jgi:V/A-type H+-transporting ATPase subunit E
MSTKVNELTNKIYTEGIEKAKKDAKQIISNAEKEAEKIINDSKLKAEQYLANAEKDAKELAKNTESELRLASQKFISSLKQTISKLITTAQTESPVKQAVNDAEFVQKMILALLKNWKSDASENPTVEILLPEQYKDEFDSFFEKKAKESLNSGMNINYDPRITSGFRIKSEKGNYYISFTDKDFENYFKTYLKNKTNKLLFGE